MKTLITGASGFVGRFLIEHLVENGDTVRACDLSDATTHADFAPTCQWSTLDVTKKTQVEQVLGEFKPDVIYHLAGISFVPEAENNFDKALLVNVGGVANLYSIGQKLGLPIAIVLVSSAEVYGRFNGRDLPLLETTPLRPANNYGLSKAMAELVTRRHGFSLISSVIMRPFNHIGPGQREDFVVSSFAKQLAEIKLGKREPIMKVGNLAAQRDFCDVRDVVRAYRLAAVRGDGVYNLCSGRGTTIQEILDQLVEISGVNVKIESDPARMRPSEIPVKYGSYRKAQDELGWEPKISLEHSLRDCFNWWSKRLQ